jgi:parvulin-like peptidyl-prolyl isomerase
MGVGGVPAVAATSSTAAAAAGATAPLAAAAAAAGPAAAAAAAAPPSIVTAGAEQMVFDDSDGMSMEERRAMTPKYRFGEVQIKQQIEERALSLDERLAAALKGAS